MNERIDKLIGYLLRVISTGPELAENKIHDLEKNLFPLRSSFVKIRKYTDDFLSSGINQRILILPGLRGVGKTTLLFQTFNRFLKIKNIPKENLLYFSLDYLKENLGASLSEIIDLYERIILKEPLEKLKEPLFLFIDEAHYDYQWQIVTKNLYDRTNKIFILVSGSSALALGASADLVRRSIIDEVLPLTFQEYLYLKKGFFPPGGTAQKIRVALNSKLDEAKYILSEVYKKLQKKFLDDSINIEKELNNFLITGGLPSSLNDEKHSDTFRWLENVLEKIIMKDIPSYSELSTRESHNVFSILHFLAENIPPGPQSAARLSQRTGTKISETTIFNMMKALEKSCVVMPLLPNSSSLKLTKKAPKYYFCTPTIRSTLLWSLGKFNEFDSKIKGILLEEAILGILIKNIKKQNVIQRVSYDYGKEGADFIIGLPTGNVILEVGWGEKDIKQIKKTMERIKFKFGVLASETKEVKVEQNIIKIPKELILFS